LRKKIRSFNI